MSVIKENLIKVKNSIRKKFRDLHNQQIELNDRLQEEFKPIVEPLRKIRDIISKPTTTTTRTGITADIITPERHVDKNQMQFSENFRTAKTKVPPRKRLFANVSNAQRKIGKKVHSHQNKVSNNIENDSFEENFSNLSNSDTEMHQEIDTKNTSTLKPQSSSSTMKRKKNVAYDRYQTRALNNPTYYNIYHVDNRLFIGSEEIKIHHDFIFVKDKKYVKTHGLMDLLMMLKPKNFSQSDLDAYKSIIIDTNCHRLNFQSNQRIVRNMSDKYKSIIQKLFPIRNGGSIDKHKCKKQFSQTQFMIADKRNNTYTYWDDPNELVERLRLLIASQSAGHTGHTNEILSIIEELKESKIIK